MLKKLFSISGLALTVSSAYAVETIDVAILYTKEARDNLKNSDTKKQSGDINLYIDHMVSQGNLALKNSKTNTQVRRLPVENALVLEKESYILNYQKCYNYYGRRECRTDSLGWIQDNSKQVREKYGADLVVLVIDGRTKYGCGLGHMAPNSGVNKGAAFSWISTECGAEGLIHEIGHNLGLGHGHRQDKAHSLNGGYGSIDSNARGYYEMGRFHTIMAYNFVVDRNGQTRIHQSIPYFSNPNIKAEYIARDSWGRAVNRETVTPSDGARNAANGIRKVASSVAKFMPTVVTVGEPTPSEPKPEQPTQPETPKPNPPTKPVTPIPEKPNPKPEAPTSEKPSPKPPVKPQPPKPVPPVTSPEQPAKPTNCTVKIRLPFSADRWLPAIGFGQFGNSSMSPISVEGQNCQSILTSLNSIWGLFKSLIYKISGNSWYKGISQDITQQLRPNENIRFCAQMALSSQQSMRRWGVTLLRMDYNNGKPTTYRRVAQRSLTSGYFSKVCGNARINDEEAIGLNSAKLVYMVPNHNNGFYFRQGRIRNL
ncbi:M12 family metallo-peptidase [Spartinivicinus ruber]|uniref:M12 family metallo-peptidase n=1 Tax=Spartinivicinus ruber TaxID=2683272 RepID=UPI0013D27998|nr:M12 family metallo-peptidase [Spartinivicinus ruber]